ncbi:MAG: aldehyde dehydrogenase family protein [Bacteroidetes bacterium]|nr:aldehyde dehydrogenase family protein [Bacteroidota bacterium]
MAPCIPRFAERVQFMDLYDLIPLVDEIPADSRPPFVELRQYLCSTILETEGSPHPVFSPIPVRDGDLVRYPLLGSYPDLGENEAAAVLDAALEAFDSGDGVWPSLALEERAERVRNFIDALRPLRDVIALHIMWEVGKVHSEALNEFDRTLEYALETVDAALALDKRERRDTSLQQVIGRVDLLPIGVVLCVGPYNYPFYETLTNAIPALLMGNSVIIKAPPRGGLLYTHLLPHFAENFPAGTIGLLFGDGERLLTPLMASGYIDVFAFIGSSAVADSLIALHPQPHRLHKVLGLEAKNAAIVFPDAPMDITIEECVKGALAFNGQRCAAIKMILVHEDIAVPLLDRMVAELEKIEPGMPWHDVRCTPLSSPEHATWLAELLDDAVCSGATVRNSDGGECVYTMMRPALLTGVTADMRIFEEEQFGPIIPVLTFREEHEALSYLKYSRFGQQCSVFGTSPEQLTRIVTSAARYVGRVNINGKCQRGPDHFPFTGKRDSAFGTVSIEEALRRFCISTVIATPEYPENTELWTKLF